jgi:hypothetical protein
VTDLEEWNKNKEMKSSEVPVGNAKTSNVRGSCVRIGNLSPATPKKIH